MYQPKTGAKCSCKRGVMRDNCSTCEGTGYVIDFRAIRNRAMLGDAADQAALTVQTLIVPQTLSDEDILRDYFNRQRDNS